MGSEHLLTALRCEGEKKAEIIRQEAAAAADRLKNEAGAGLARVREKFSREQARAIAAEESAILAEAERTARRLWLAAVEDLAGRLFELAQGLLPSLREKEYPEIFSLLVGELSPLEWETVRVNPDDAALAARHFPRARIIPEPAIRGGMATLAAGGLIEINNTLEKRLERGWPELLPVIIKETEQCMN